MKGRLSDELEVGGEDLGEARPKFERYPSLNTRLCDFLPTPYDGSQQELVVDWDELRDWLITARRNVAKQRCRASIDKLRRDGLIA